MALPSFNLPALLAHFTDEELASTDSLAVTYLRAAALLGLPPDRVVVACSEDDGNDGLLCQGPFWSAWYKLEMAALVLEWQDPDGSTYRVAIMPNGARVVATEDTEGEGGNVHHLFFADDAGL